MSNSSLSRREFLQFSASGAAMLGLSSSAGIKINPWARPCRPRSLVPGAKVRIAQIGCGGQGSRDISAFEGENVVALCDVDWGNENAQKVFKKFPNATRYKNFRQMLLEMDDQIDAVVVSTPDHMHFLPAYMAISMGKHVYVQKPMCQTIWEARELLKLSRRNGVCTQMGNQGHASEGVRLSREWIQAGLLGPVHEAHIWTNRPVWPQGMEERPADEPVPAQMDWDRWLGRAPYRDYNHAYLPFVWRGWRDFGCGALGDMGCHTMDAVCWSLNLHEAIEQGALITVEAESSGLTSEAFPNGAVVTYQFPARGAMPPVRVKWYEGTMKPPRPADLEADRKLSDNGHVIIGEKATIYDSTEYGFSPRIIPEAKMQKMLPLLPPKSIPRVTQSNPHVEWLEAIRAGQPRHAGSNFEYSARLTEFVLLGNLAILSGQKILWDSAKMHVTNLPAANQFVKPSFRQGWEPASII